ncbi:sugar diacid recognition domain-containing protein [Ectopseudomonas oleovorans]|uniref:CdaR family transcriptional regulator n=1 Tax=Ectopseudomonas oleovorans TaxID=301 RepID=A0A379KAC9_ECTOL|nr:sugar diacid recognition domain-containing protein [Pseudomonas oleovorans]PZP83179.1 MAG: CdaR family transcriptional regulator [Pseudomonas oleovorans]RRW39095.1 CdaR family transcriptional regulator [Pseudomonas oleovorans]SUD61101.1 CdaR family transcriptional regulator [Pseudomonas oleovorans]
MLELDSTLAQHIVDRAMAILPHNINVMDAQGMIIGSGDPSRLHTRHEGAQLVLANRRVVEIDAQAAACLRGVKPGVNLPLLHAERLIGVLGITGDPEIVRPYAELVRMAAEMLVEHRVLQAERHWQRHQQEAWLRQLLDPMLRLSSLEVDAERLGLQLTWPRQMCLLQLDGEGDPLPRQARLLAALGGKSEHLVAPLGRHELLWCRPYSTTRDDRAWLQQADEREWGVSSLALSDPLHDLTELRQASLVLRDLQAYGQARFPGRRLLRLDELRLPTLLYAQRHSWLLQGWLAPLRQVLMQDPQGTLRATLEAWCAHDGQVQTCAQELGIHRNTLRYRLERIGELSGLDLNRFDQRLQLSLGLGLLGVEDNKAS